MMLLCLIRPLLLVPSTLLIAAMGFLYGVSGVLSMALWQRS
ncbi:MAG: hypothetical protein R2865_00310 [Deinococcales bacterium]